MAFSADDARKTVFNQHAQRIIDSAEASIKAAAAQGKRECRVPTYEDTKEPLMNHLRSNGYQVSIPPGCNLAYTVKW